MKVDAVARVGLGILSASNSNSGDREPPKKELKVSGHRVTLVNCGVKF